MSALDRFLRHVVKSGLLDQGQLDGALRSLPSERRGEVRVVAEFLIRSGRLSRFQAVKLLQGRSKGLLLGHFQVLLEAGLLPGAMLRNRRLQFRCEFLHVRVEQTATPFTTACRPGQTIKIPIAHGDGNYYAEPDGIDRTHAEQDAR